jgi:hypothetical protein
VRFGLAAALAAAAVLAACGADKSSPTTGTASSGAGASGSSARESGTPSPSGSGNSVLSKQYQNPVYDKDFPDPAVLRVGSRYYAYGTQGGGSNIQVLTSPDLTQWTAADDACRRSAAGRVTGSTWAAEVFAGQQVHDVLRRA